MCMSSENQRSSSNGNSTTKPPVATPGIDHSTGIGSNVNHSHMQQQQQQQPLRGLSPRSVMSSASSSSSSSDSRMILNHIENDDDDVNHKNNRNNTNSNHHIIPSVVVDDRDDSCWRQGLVRLRRGRMSEPRSNHQPTNTISMTTTRTTSTTTTNEHDPSNHTRPNSLLLDTNTKSIVIWNILAAIFVAMAIIWFSFVLPFVLAPSAAIQTYVFAQWMYHISYSQFDNTIWTYGTDYFLALCMMTLIHMIPYHHHNHHNNSNINHNHKSSTTTSSFNTTAYYTRGLLGSYMISVLAGGMAHQTFTTIALQNTMYFRIVWTICVGAVAMASAFMGAAATSLLQYCTTTSSTKPSSIPYYLTPTVSFWFIYAFCITTMVILGGFSFQRPACDIFVVGITQFPSTFYMMFVLLYGFNSHNTNNHNKKKKNMSSNPVTTILPNDKDIVLTLSNRLKYMACCGFILNAPLLPLYPILVQYTNWSLGGINTLLHTWLLMAWTCQGMSLRQIGFQMMILEQQQGQQPMNSAVPVQPQPLVAVEESKSPRMVDSS